MKNKKLNNKTELFEKLQNLDPKNLNKIGLNFENIEYLKELILDDKLGLKLKFFKTKEDIENPKYILLNNKEKSKNINLKENNNNLLIEGENLHCLKALKICNLKVDIIYIDPPYNTGNEFIYNDKRTTKDDPYSHSKWLSFMKKRLEIARELMKEDAVIFISIDDNEQAYLKVLMDEIFGEENFISNINWISNKKGRQISNSIFIKTYEYILVYSKNKILNENNYKYLIDRKYLNNLMPSIYNDFDLSKIYEDNISKYIVLNKLHNTNIRDFNIKTRPNLYFPIFIYNKIISLKKQNEKFVEILPPKNLENVQGVWRWSKTKILNEKNNLIIRKNIRKNKYEIFTKKREIRFLPKDVILSSSITTKSGTNELEKLNLKFNNPKPSSLIKFLIGFTNKNAIILDFLLVQEPPVML